MGCRTIISYLDRYADNELAPHRRREVEGHIATCPACRQRLAAMREVASLLASSPPVPPVPSGFHARVMAEARRRQAMAGKRSGWAFTPLRALFGVLSPPMRLAAGLTALLAVATGLGLSSPGLVRQQEAEGNHNDINGFEWFAPAPPASMSAVYLAMIDETHPQGSK